MAHTPHSVKTILSSKAAEWISDLRMIKYETTLLHKDHLTLTTCTVQNPAQFLYGVPDPNNLLHNCIHIIDLQTKVREDLVDVPLHEGEKLFIDGSSRIIEGKRCSGCAVVDGLKMKILEKGKLPATWSAQVCELYALEKALNRLAGSIGTIYTDSKYAYGIVHTFGKIWAERAFLNSKGKDLLHKELILKILKSLQQPLGIAVVHVPGHQTGQSVEARGNNLADLAAEEAATETPLVLEVKTTTDCTESANDKDTLPMPIFSEKEKQKLLAIGGKKVITYRKVSGASRMDAKF